MTLDSNIAPWWKSASFKKRLALHNHPQFTVNSESPYFGFKQILFYSTYSLGLFSLPFWKSSSWTWEKRFPCRTWEKRCAWGNDCSWRCKNHAALFSHYDWRFEHKIDNSETCAMLQTNLPLSKKISPPQPSSIDSYFWNPLIWF